MACIQSPCLQVQAAGNKSRRACFCIPTQAHSMVLTYLKPPQLPNALGMRSGPLQKLGARCESYEHQFVINAVAVACAEALTKATI